jgi:eukaryotic-like serine/threonine-protein kinase
LGAKTTVDVAQRLTAVLADRYEIERELGRGGMALVFLARDLKHGRRVAVKVLRPDLSALIGAERFVREVQIEAQLQHPHIVPLYDSGDAEGLPYYVMAYVEGESLRERLKREKQLPLADAVRIASDVAEALGHAHSLGVVHRDIKPENILLSGGHAVVADFGVARALSAAAGDLTGSGLAVGTPAYMSPEQAGGQEVDGRSDLYALGCVLYEMLTGWPPFTGPTPQAVLARHMQETVPGIRIVRDTVPESVERVVRTLLAKTPADRYPTASRVIEALTQRSEATGNVVPRARRRMMTVGMSIGVAGVVLAWWFFGRGPVLDPLAYVVLPFDPRSGAELTLLDGVQSQQRLTDELRRWDQVTVAEPIVVADAARRRADTHLDHGDWLHLARDLGYGTMVRGQIEEFDDSVSLHVTAYRARSGRVVGHGDATYRPASDDVRRTFASLAVQLLGLAEPGRGRGATGTRSLEAGRAFAEGQQSLVEGDLAAAEERFLQAGQSDPAYEDAHFWLAQVRVWQGLPADVWRHGARRVAEARADLVDPDVRALARALLDLAEQQFPEACARYRALIASDSSSFAAWFGLGDCNYWDRTVVSNSRSPSGWSFRGSYHAAAEAYRRGLAVAPFLFSPVMARLRRVLFVEPARLQQGHAQDGSAFQAYPALAGDTLAFVPYPAADVRSGLVGEPATYRAALDRNRFVLMEVVRSRAETYPRSAEALAAWAASLEDFGRTGQEEVSRRPGQRRVALTDALDVARRARRLSPPRLESVRLAHMEVRLLAKLEEFAAARALADSLLRAEPEPDPQIAELLAPIAALIGQPHRAADFLERARPLAQFDWRVELADVPVAALATLERLRAYAAIGAPLDSVRRLSLVIDSLLALRGRAQETELSQIFEEPMVLAFPVVGPTPTVHRPGALNHLARLQARLAAGDEEGVRAGLDSLDAGRAGLRPQDVAMGAFFQEMWLRLQVGDTAAVVVALDRMLGDLPGLPSRAFTDLTDAAALVRVMVLRATLGGAGAARWARAVRELWRGAGPELAPVLQAMNSIAP